MISSRLTNMSSFGKGTVDDGLSLFCAGTGRNVAGDEIDVRESLATVKRTDYQYYRMQTTFRGHCKASEGKILKLTYKIEPQLLSVHLFQTV